MFLFFNQAKALLLASYSTGSVTIENKVVTANKIIPINNKDGKVLIYKQSDKFFGKVSSGKDGSRKDIHNPDAKLKEQNIVGSIILKGFDFTGKAWENGTIYDPNNGKTYSCTMKMKNANELEIRGFIGISLFGRTQYWSRIKN